MAPGIRTSPAMSGNKMEWDQFAPPLHLLQEPPESQPPPWQVEMVAGQLSKIRFGTAALLPISQPFPTWLPTQLQPPSPTPGALESSQGLARSDPQPRVLHEVHLALGQVHCLFAQMPLKMARTSGHADLYCPLGSALRNPP